MKNRCVATVPAVPHLEEEVVIGDEEVEHIAGSGVTSGIVHGKRDEVVLPFASHQATRKQVVNQ